MYTQFEPPDDLKHIVCFFYAMDHHRDDEPLQLLLPSGTEINGWQYAGNWNVDLNNGAPFILPDFYMVGQQTISYKLSPVPEAAAIFGAALQPGSIHKLTGKPAHLFTNAPVAINTLFSSEQVLPFIEQFKIASDNMGRKQVVTDFYRQFRVDQDIKVYTKALNLIYAQRGCITVKEICEKLKINERYLQREFRLYVGVPPSVYLQLIRFNNIFTELSLSEEKQNIETLAMLFNYYDISHFNKTHKKYFGVGPSKLVLDKLKLLEELIRDKPYLLQVQTKNIF